MSGISFFLSLSTMVCQTRFKVEQNYPCNICSNIPIFVNRLIDIKIQERIQDFGNGASE